MQIPTEGLVDERLNINDGQFRPWHHRSRHGLRERHQYLREGFLDDLWFGSRKMIEVPLVGPSTTRLLGLWTCGRCRG